MHSNDFPFIENILATLTTQDYCVVPQAFSKERCAALVTELDPLPLRLAGIGRGSEQQINLDLRNDHIHWLSTESPQQAYFLKAMDALRTALNQHCFMGLDHYEAHYARYEQGGYYRRHLDSFQGSNPRRVSSVLYLNPDWQAENGGLLNLYRDEHDNMGLEVKPEAGTLVIFLSEKVPHEVRPAQRARRSIAGWFRVRG